MLLPIAISAQYLELLACGVWMAQIVVDYHWVSSQGSSLFGSTAVNVVKGEYARVGQPAHGAPVSTDEVD
jgi:hypothetical protein